MIIFFIIVIIVIGGFVGCFAVSISDAKGVRAWTIGIITALVFNTMLFGGIYLENKIDHDNWNDGICSACGEQFELFGASHERNSGDVYYYKCSNGHVIQTHHVCH